MCIDFVPSGMRCLRQACYLVLLDHCLVSETKTGTRAPPPSQDLLGIQPRCVSASSKC